MRGAVYLNSTSNIINRAYLLDMLNIAKTSDESNANTTMIISEYSLRNL